MAIECCVECGGEKANSVPTCRKLYRNYLHLEHVDTNVDLLPHSCLQRKKRLTANGKKQYCKYFRSQLTTHLPLCEHDRQRAFFPSYFFLNVNPRRLCHKTLRSFTVCVCNTEAAVFDSLSHTWHLQSENWNPGGFVKNRCHSINSGLASQR